MQIELIGQKRIFHYAGDGPLLASEADAIMLVEQLYGRDIDIIAIPAHRLSEDFYRLETGFAGAFLQKLQNYGHRVAVVGDVSSWTHSSTALADFIRESTRRNLTLFVPDQAALAAAV